MYIFYKNSSSYVLHKNMYFTHTLTPQSLCSSPAFLEEANCYVMTLWREPHGRGCEASKLRALAPGFQEIEFF
jgi:hypothetical protein